MSLAFDIPTMKEHCLLFLKSRTFKDILYQKSSFNKLSELSFLNILQIHYELTKPGEIETPQYLQQKEITTAIKDYYAENFQDENIREEKTSQCLQLFLIADPHEPGEGFETFPSDEHYYDPKFLKTHLQFFQTRVLKLEKQNCDLMDEVKDLRSLLEAMSAESRTMKEKVDKVDRVVEQNEELKSTLSKVVEVCQQLKLVVSRVDSQLLIQGEEIKSKIDAGVKAVKEEIREESTKMMTISLESRAQPAKMKNDADAKIAEVREQMKNDIKNSQNEVIEKIVGIQQQLVVQSDEFNHIKESINQLKPTILATQQQQQPSPQQQQILSQPEPTSEGIVINGTSSIITSSHLGMLKEWIPKDVFSPHLKTCRLDFLYKGSRDGFQAKRFHLRCDNKTPTICFIKSQTYGRVFGGYTEQSWNDLGLEQGSHKRDDDAFIFSLTHGEKFPVIKDANAILAHIRYSVAFSQDICISGDHGEGYTNFPSSYKCDKLRGKTDQSQPYLAGSYNFKAEEIEVYQTFWI